MPREKKEEVEGGKKGRNLSFVHQVIKPDADKRKGKKGKRRGRRSFMMWRR